MAGYNYNLKSIIQGAKQVASSEMLIPARVVDVILDSSHPEFEKYGKWSAIGAIKYRALSRQLEENTTADLPVAYPMQAHIKHIPLKNEIVLITASPSELLSESSNSTKNYYLDIVNLWNHPHHNAFPSNITSPSKGSIGLISAAFSKSAPRDTSSSIFEGNALW